jgi:hypothetical protein
MRCPLVVLLAPVLLLAGCPGSLENPGSFDVADGIDGGGGSFAAANRIDGGGGSETGCAQPIAFATTCAVSGCHAATTPAGGLDLASPNIAMRLLGKQAMGGPGLLIDPANATASVLYTKLTTTPPFGARMPLVGAPLSDADLACALSWIQASTKGAL